MSRRETGGRPSARLGRDKQPARSVPGKYTSDPEIRPAEPDQTGRKQASYSQVGYNQGNRDQAGYDQAGHSQTGPMTRLGRGLKQALRAGGRLLYGCRWYLVFLGAVGCWAGAFRLFRGNRELMNALADHVTGPYKRIAARVCDFVPFSVSEIAIYLCVLGGVFWLISLVRALRRGRGRRAGILLRRVLAVLCAVMAAYTGFVYLWGVNYYTDSFQEKSGIYAAPPSVQELYRTAQWFAQRLNEAGAEVERDKDGRYAVPMEQVIADSGSIYGEAVTGEFPFLRGDAVRPKPFLLSEILSYLNTTGFFFPWLGESNFNAHSPPCDRPATIAHELAHQRGIASEQEANFVAVLTSTRSESAAYRYSGYMLGYVYLNNALIQADPALWREVYGTLSPEVLLDLREKGAYWDAHRNLITKAADSIVDQRLKNYGQELGRKSYGAVVDLLVVYYGRGGS